MGYTHYWHGTAPVLTDTLADQIRAVFAHCADNGIALADGYGEGEPEVSEERLWVNGAGDDSYETFGVDFGMAIGFDFCKTAEQPYDLAVVAILELLTAHGEGKFSWTSDGDGTNRLDAGKALAEQILS